MQAQEAMEGALREEDEQPQLRYEMRGMGHTPEDILFCVDADVEVNVEMKVGGGKVVAGGGGGGGGGGGMSRLDAIKQAILLFVHSKLTVHPQHKFAFATLHNTASWIRREFTNDTDVISHVVRGLAASGSFPRCDLSELFRMAAGEAQQSHALDRRFRVVLIYCRSSVMVDLSMQWLDKMRLFTFDALYLHDKPTRENCPQSVYDSLVDVLERVSEFESYIFESSSGSARLLFRNTCMLLSHPQQRCPQHEFDAPKDLAKLLAPPTPPRNSTPGSFPVPTRPGDDEASAPRAH